MVFIRIQLSRYVLAFSYIGSLSLVVITRSILYHFLPLAKAARGWNRRILTYGAGELLIRNLAVATTQIQRHIPEHSGGTG